MTTATTETKTKQTRIVRLASEAPTSSSVGGVQLQMAGLVFGPNRAKVPQDVALLFKNGDMLSVVGAVSRIVVTDALFGRLDFCRDAESKVVEARWDADELSMSNVSLTIEVLDAAMSGENEDRKMVGSGWKIQAVTITNP